MTFMMFLSHGTQDLYPDFLRTEHGAAIAAMSTIVILGNIGADGRGDYLRADVGRRRTAAEHCSGAVLSLAVMPLWAFGGSLAHAGAGIVSDAGGRAGRVGNYSRAPERAVRTTHARIGARAWRISWASCWPRARRYVEYALRDRFGYKWALAGFEIVTIVVLVVTISLGKERRGRDFLNPSEDEEPERKTEAPAPGDLIPGRVSREPLT